MFDDDRRAFFVVKLGSDTRRVGETGAFLSFTKKRFIGY